MRIWDLLTGHARQVNAVAAVPTPDGRTLLIVASTDGLVRIWDLLTGQSVGQLLTGQSASQQLLTGQLVGQLLTGQSAPQQLLTRSARRVAEIGKVSTAQGGTLLTSASTTRPRDSAHGLRGRTFSDLVASLNAGQHLAVDAMVAFVDGELAAGPRDRAAHHLTNCEACAAEVAAQRQARSVIRSARCPSVPAGLLAALRDIPLTTDLPSGPKGLSMTEDGALGAVADPARAPIAPLGGTAPLGVAPHWGAGSSTLGRRIEAGVVVSGLVLGALIMTMLEDPVTGSAGQQPERQPPTLTVSSAVPAVVLSTLGA